MKILVCPTALLPSLFLSTAAFAQTVLYDLDFTAPEVGSYSVLYGAPTVVPSFYGMSDALLFRAKGTNWDAITLSLGARPSGYTIDFDVFTYSLRNSSYSFNVLLSTPGTRTVYFHGGENAIEVYQPYPYTDQGVLAFADYVRYHVTILSDFPNNRWELAVNGVPVYENVFNASDIQDVGFSLTPWFMGARDNPNVLVALDNIRVEAIPEPSACSLLVFALLVARGSRRLLLYER